jgi:ribonuclease PH
MIRFAHRTLHALRPIQFDCHYTRHATGSVRIGVGHTQILCTASVENKVPSHRKGTGQGWVTAEYGMLPGSTHTRNEREAVKGKQNGRTQEIQRLIGRSLRAVFDMQLLGERTVILDCDVLQADGGTRTASITGAYVAAQLAIHRLMQEGVLSQSPIRQALAAVSVGIVQGHALLDLDYAEDSQCDSDINVVMTEEGQFVEVQGSAEGASFARPQFDALLDLAQSGIAQLMAAQKQALAQALKQALA